MFSSWIEIWDSIKKHLPFSKKRLSFISIHYIYMISVTMIGSLLVFASGGLDYIDALFFASGAATQSGLNTVDVNLLHTYQQLVIYFIAMIANPIFIHSFVVFVRLYWFERRFQHVVREARTLRRTKSRSRTNTQAVDDSQEEKEHSRGVNGRRITVIRRPSALGGDGANDHGDQEKQDLEALVESSNSSDRNSAESSNAAKGTSHIPSKLRTDVVSVRSPDSAPLRIPETLDAERHIAFLENQRNPKDKETLRIPSPREWDRGGLPESVDDADDGGLARHVTSLAEPPMLKKTQSEDPTRNHITIDDSPINRARSRTTTFPRAAPRRAAGVETKEPNEPNEPPASAFARAKARTGTFSSMLRPAASFMRSTSQDPGPIPYLSWQPTIGRNSAFFDLSEQQREELGGIEYRALKTLAVVLVTYFLAFHVLGVLCLAPWIMKTNTYGEIVREDGQGRVWWAFFTSASAFNDLGFTLTPDSMISFGRAVFPLLLMTFLIVIGNTGFPCMLRFVIWMLSKCVTRGSGIWEELRFLLDHPRRCFTLLFPGQATWWLFWILVILNGVDLVFFIILDLNDPVVSTIPPGLRFLDGLFQASSTRTAGFSVVNLAYLHPAIQVSYLIMMYISVFPIAISMRRTNVYEEKSLGIYAAEDEDEDDQKEPSYVGAHLRRQLGFDLWYVFLGMFIIAIVEGSRLSNINQPAFTLFSVLFEIVSAYGTVGLSLGYPGVNTSFSAQFRVLSKLVMIAMQIRGRHRGLPYDLDRAILLPSESLQRKELADAEKRQNRRRNSNASILSSSGTRPLRQESSLTSGREHGEGPMQRISSAHESHIRSGLGTAMARLSEHPEDGEWE